MDQPPGSYKLRTWFATISSTTWSILQIAALILSFGAGSVTGSITSYINLRTDTEELRAKLLILDNRVTNIDQALTNLRKDDHDIFVDIHGEITTVRDLLNELLMRAQGTRTR